MGKIIQIENNSANIALAFREQFRRKKIGSSGFAVGANQGLPHQEDLESSSYFPPKLTIHHFQRMAF